MNNAKKYCHISTYRTTILAKKKHLFSWSSFWSWRVCKQTKLSHLGHKNFAKLQLHWKADASKTSHCLARILVQRHNKNKMSNERPLQSMAIVIGPCWTNFCSQKLKRTMLATFGFNRTPLCATQPELHSIFYAMFLKINLSAAELMSFGHLGAVTWNRWTIICGLPSKISVKGKYSWSHWWNTAAHNR